MIESVCTHKWDFETYGTCPMCPEDMKSRHSPDYISTEMLRRIEHLSYTNDLPSRYVRMMASELLSLRQQIAQMQAPAVEPAQAVPVGYRLQSIAEFDAMNEWIMSGKHDQKAIDHDKKQKAFHFVRWIASLKTGGLIQARANDLLSMLETDNE